MENGMNILIVVLYVVMILGLIIFTVFTIKDSKQFNKRMKKMNKKLDKDFEEIQEKALKAQYDKGFKEGSDDALGVVGLHFNLLLDTFKTTKEVREYMRSRAGMNKSDAEHTIDLMLYKKKGKKNAKSK